MKLIGVTFILCMAGLAFSRVFPGNYGFDGNVDDPVHGIVEGAVRPPGAGEVWHACAGTQYGCCADLTPAEDASGSSCAKKGCYDNPKSSCKYYKSVGTLKCDATSDCYYSCGNRMPRGNRCEMKHPSPKKSCETKNPGRRCCWNGEVEMNGKCSECVDELGTVNCERMAAHYGSCESGSPYLRKSFDKCVKTCGNCW